MASDDALLRRVRQRLTATEDIVEKPMVGGIGFLWRGNLLCGVMGDELLVRLAARDAAELDGNGGAHPMVMAGQVAKSWMLIPPTTVRTDAGLTSWLARAFAFGATLPPK